jgi:YHS domain-containing protein
MKSKLALLASTLIALAGCASTDTTSTASVAQNPGVVKPYPLKTCIVMDDALDKDAYTFVYQGQEIKLCCEGCKDDFNKKPSKYLKKLAKK